MPKLKTHSGIKKRIKITRNGKVLRRPASRSHFLLKKTHSTKRKLAINKQLSGKNAKNVKKALGV